jgi:hypothetical protein
MTEQKLKNRPDVCAYENDNREAARLDSLTARLLRLRLLACGAASLGVQFPKFRKCYGT